MHPVLPDGLEKLGAYAFADCESLTGLTLPSSITKLEEGLLSSCNSITEFDFGNMQITEIGDYAFASCENLVSITIPEGVTELGSNVFYRCYGLKEVHISDTVEKFGDSVFAQCKALEKVYIPATLTKYGRNIFDTTNKDVLTVYCVPDSDAEIMAKLNEVQYEAYDFG